jgi:hypothetical protein
VRRCLLRFAPRATPYLQGDRLALERNGGPAVLEQLGADIFTLLLRQRFDFAFQRGKVHIGNRIADSVYGRCQL